MKTHHFALIALTVIAWWLADRALDKWLGPKLDIRGF